MLPDHLCQGLRAIFIGINPGIRSAETGHHYAGRGNRFWPLLHDAGLIHEPLEAQQDARLPSMGFGLSNIVERVTPGVAQLAGAELAAGSLTLREKLAAYRPEWAVFVGLTVYRAMFQHRGRLACGPQEPALGDTRCWVVPNPSGRNTHYTYDALLALYRRLAEQLARPRFTLLAHHTEPLHYDLLLERPDSCWTWRLTAPPGEPLEATRIADHRKHYLTYEGEVSGGRGRVERVDRGTYVVGQAGEVLLDGLESSVAVPLAVDPEAFSGPC